MARRGRTPSLIGGSAGKCEIVVARGKRPCKRCNSKIQRGTTCVEVRIPGTQRGRKNYCVDCFKEILEQTQKDIDNLFTEIQEIQI